MQSAVLAIADLSIRPCVRHFPMICPEEWRYVWSSASGSTMALVHEEIKFVRIFSGIPESGSVKLKRPLSLTKIWPIIRYNLEIVRRSTIAYFVGVSFANGKSHTGFPMRLRWITYTAPQPPMGSKTQNGPFSQKVHMVSASGTPNTTFDQRLCHIY